MVKIEYLIQLPEHLDIALGPDRACHKGSLHSDPSRHYLSHHIAVQLTAQIRILIVPVPALDKPIADLYYQRLFLLLYLKSVYTCKI